MAPQSRLFPAPSPGAAAPEQIAASTRVIFPRQDRSIDGTLLGTTHLRPPSFTHHAAVPGPEAKLCSNPPGAAGGGGFCDRLGVVGGGPTRVVVVGSKTGFCCCAVQRAVLHAQVGRRFSGWFGSFAWLRGEVGEKVRVQTQPGAVVFGHLSEVILFPGCWGVWAAFWAFVIRTHLCVFLLEGEITWQH